MHRHKYLVKENYYGDSITLQESLHWFEQILQIFKNRCFQLYILIILLRSVYPNSDDILETVLKCYFLQPAPTNKFEEQWDSSFSPLDA